MIGRTLDRLGVVSTFRETPWGVASLLLSFPQITTPTGFLQLTPLWGHLKASCQHPRPSLSPPRANMSALGVQKQSFEAHPGAANGHKTHLAWTHIWQSGSIRRYAAETCDSGKEIPFLPCLFNLFYLQNANHNCLIIIFMDRSLPAPDLPTLMLSTFDIPEQQRFMSPPHTSKLRRQVLRVPSCLWGYSGCSSGYIHGHRKPAPLLL